MMSVKGTDSKFTYQRRRLPIEDISDQIDNQEDLEEVEPLDAIEPATNQTSGPHELDDVLDVLLNRDGNQDPESQVVGDIVMEADVSVAEDMDHHDSQMISQEISIGDDDDPDETAHDIHNDDDSGSDADDDDDDENDDDENDDDGGETEDDDADDEEDEEDDEGSDMEAEDEDDYQDMETALTMN
ncbi:hypothetical protein FSP39_014958 [Pinctada imbricata]|uniref:Uncharacterized protein n=1 Tax=Pinctada imbricata TaxID=66713 RepID=A0AA88YN84_PINIB|nr:hypothetical protein FSP39_014958 [Pinctada imbricata]